MSKTKSIYDFECPACGRTAWLPSRAKGNGEEYFICTHCDASYKLVTKLEVL